MFKSFSQSRECFSLGLCLGIDCRYLLASRWGDWVAYHRRFRQIPISAARFWSLDFLIFTLTTLFA